VGVWALIFQYVMNGAMACLYSLAISLNMM
jgi:hypothetical protein